MKGYLFIILASILVTGCKTAPEKPLPEPMESYVVHPAAPPGMQMREIRWRVLNREKLDQLLKEQKGDIVLFALTAKAYENMSLNMQEIIRYIEEQKEIIIYYRKNFPDNEPPNTE